MNRLKTKVSKKTLLPMLEESGHTEIPQSTEAPIYEEISSTTELFDTDKVVRDLRKVGWDFTTDDTSYLSHDIHPYPAKFIPQIPGHLIARLSLRGDLVMDPFGGSGTTALEAVRLGRRAISVDANRVGVLAGRVKTSRLDRVAIRDIHSIRTALLANLEELPSDAAVLIQQYQQYIPEIHNRTKWFSETSTGELALIRSLIQKLDTQTARDVSSLAMSRIIFRVSNQDSETRYASKPRSISSGETTKHFLKALDAVVRDVQETASDIRFGVAEFVEADTRYLNTTQFPNDSVDLIVTSPPYGNAMDYHLYHRFRLFWLGSDPKELAKHEVGSHLRHQKESNGYDHYRYELGQCVTQMARVLRSGRYAAIIVGDALYDGTTYSGGKLVSELGETAGLKTIDVIERPLHRTKRSFAAAGRRAISESIVLLQKPEHACRVCLDPPPYRLWDYESVLRKREAELLAGTSLVRRGEALHGTVSCRSLPILRRVAFSHVIRTNEGRPEQTWQAIVENGLAYVESSRKDPKYVTHGIHPYKGKFYPQLAKSLINLVGIEPGATVFDPFCGSGTTLLEAYLNGMIASGTDLNPIAAKIARAKVGVLELDPFLVTEAVETLIEKLDSSPKVFPVATDQFGESAVEEIKSWFPDLVIGKLNWLLRAVRSVSAGVLRDFFEVLVSSIIRDVSQQEPTDLRIRRRKVPLKDAAVLEPFKLALETQYSRIRKFWSVRGYCPYRFQRATAIEGDSRDVATVERLGLAANSVDLVLTSPPYATALPYIDTDRLSILLLHGMNSKARRPLEEHLTGSREISKAEKSRFEREIASGQTMELPRQIKKFVKDLHQKLANGDEGFRRQNMPALLVRFFQDMKSVFSNVYRVTKPGGSTMIIMGDNVTSVGGETILIPTTDFVRQVGEQCGLELVETIPITVTTENLIHVRNAIKKNVVLWFRRS